MGKASANKVIDIATRKSHKPVTKSRRKRPDEWRSISRSARVKDGRSVLLAVPDPRRAGALLVIEAWWCITSRAWWPANCASGVPGCEPVVDTYGAPTQWTPMPAPPLKTAA